MTACQVKAGTRIDLPLWLGEMLSIGYVRHCLVYRFCLTCMPEHGWEHLDWSALICHLHYRSE